MSGVYTQTPYMVSLQRYLVHLEFPKDAGFNKIIPVMLDKYSYHVRCAKLLF